MAIGFDREPEPYVLPSDQDKPEEKQTAFYLVPLDYKRGMKIMKRFVGEGDDAGMEVASEEGYELLRLTLRGWKNFKTQSGKDIPYEEDAKGFPTEETLNRLPKPIALELITEAITQNRVSEEQEKN